LKTLGWNQSVTENRWFLFIWTLQPLLITHNIG
jgi:hypothetical protein